MFDTATANTVLTTNLAATGDGYLTTGTTINISDDTTAHINVAEIRGGIGDPILGYYGTEPIYGPSISQYSISDDLLDELWERKVKPYLDALILARVTEEELRNVLKLGGDP